MGKIIKDCKLNELTVGTLFKVLNEGLFYKQLFIKTKNSIVSIDYGNIHSSISTFSNIEIIREGPSTTLILDDKKEVNIIIDTSGLNPLYNVKNLKYFFKIGLKDAKDLYDKSKLTHYNIKISMRKTDYEIAINEVDDIFKQFIRIL